MLAMNAKANIDETLMNHDILYQKVVWIDLDSIAADFIFYPWLCLNLPTPICRLGHSTSLSSPSQADMNLAFFSLFLVDLMKSYR
jgi:hypothetical protein